MGEPARYDRRSTDASVERLEKSHAWLEKSYVEQSQLVAKLLIISENNANAMARFEAWVTTHETDYRAVRERLLSQELVGEGISKQLISLTAAIDGVTKAYSSDRNKALGGWFAVAGVSGVIVSLVAVLVALKTLGLF